MNQKETVELIEYLRMTHDRRWERMRTHLQSLKACALNKYWTNEDTPDPINDGTLQIDVSVGADYLASFMGALFTNAPAVEVGPDVLGMDSAAKTEGLKEIANRWLRNERTSIERWSETALVYPSGYAKLVWNTESERHVLDRCALVPMMPWDVIVDEDADCWESQRWVGHRTFVPTVKAKKQWGRKFEGKAPSDFIEGGSVASDDGEHRTQVPDAASVVEIYEVYDLLEGRVYWWSPDSVTDKLLGNEEIPLRDHEGNYLPPIVPLYYDCQVDKPLKGRAPLSKVLSIWNEVVQLRTHTANSIRKEVDILLYDKTDLDAETIAKLQDAQQGDIIGLEGFDSSKIMNFSIKPMSQDYIRYNQELMNDLASLGATGKFMKGGVTNATATEVDYVAQYTSSNIGRMAKTRDDAIAHAVRVYFAYVELYMDGVIEVKTNQGVQSITSDDLLANVNIVPVDGASTPVTSVMQRDRINQQVGMALQMGADPAKVLPYWGRLNQIPDEVLKPAAPAPTAEPMQTTPDTTIAATNTAGPVNTNGEY